jgi:hypothetical protein
MRKIIFVITAIIAISFLLLGGCGGGKECPADCEDGNPCTADTCGKDTDYECRHTAMPGCTPDCPMPCMGPAGRYMEMQCDAKAKQCAADINPTVKISTSSLTNEMISLGNKFKIITTFSQPFNMKKDLFEMRISLSQIGSGMSNIKVKSIELTGLNAQRQTVTLGEHSVNKMLWTTETSLEEGMRIEFATSEYDGSFSNLKLRINYDYQQTYAGQSQSKTGVFEIQLRGVTFEWLNPEMTYDCPASCDDFNEGTADICNAGTDYFCTHQPIPGKCGNYICDPTENKCTCELDCGPCTGDAGQYLSFICQNRECKTMIKQGTIQQPVSKVDEKNRNFYYLQNKYTFNNPFNVNSDKFALDFKLYNQQSQVSGVRIMEARVLDQSSEVAYVSIGESLPSVGSTLTAEIPVTAFAGYEDEKSLTLRVDVEYMYTTQTGSEVRKDNFLTPLGKVTLINPTLS